MYIKYGFSYFDKVFSSLSFRGFFIFLRKNIYVLINIDDQIQAINEAIRLQPHDAKLHYQLGNHLKTKKQYSFAKKAFRNAISLKPDFYEAYFNLALIYRFEESFLEAINILKKAIDIKNDYFQAYSNLASIYLELNDLKNALYSYEKALEIRPDSEEVHFNYSIVLLKLANYEKGLAEYEWRRYKAAYKANLIPGLEIWDGDLSYEGELILAREQGLGDTVFLLRFAAMLAEKVSKLSILVKDEFKSFIEKQGIFHKVYSASEKNDLSKDAKLFPLFSVLKNLEISSNQDFENGAYLKADDSLFKQWQAKFEAENSYVIGLNWQGNLDTEKISLRGRSFKLEILAALKKIPGIKFLALQKGEALEQLAYSSFRETFVSFQNEVNPILDMENTAAIVANCDLVISCDSLVAHLAGALGVETILLAHYSSEWRWGTEDKYIQWYEKMQVLRQQEKGNWLPLISELQDLINEKLIKKLDPQILAKTCDYLMQKQKYDYLEEALKVFLKINPVDPNIHANMAFALKKQSKYLEALPFYQNALKISPDDIDLLINLADLYQSLKDTGNAKKYFLRALDLDSDHAKANYEYAQFLRKESDFKEAKHHLEKAIKLKTDYAPAHVALAEINFSEANYESAYDSYEWRLQNPEFLKYKPKNLELWDGRLMQEGELVLFHEEGFGDTFQFIRFAIDLKKHIEKLSIIVPKALVEILDQSLIFDEVYNGDTLDLDNFEFSVGAKTLAIRSLPKILGINLFDIELAWPYLEIDETRVDFWAKQLNIRADKRYVALFWQGDYSREKGLMEGRSFPLELLKPLSYIENIEFIALQKGEALEQLAKTSFINKFTKAQAQISRNVNFLDSAAILKSCDCLISCDSALAHLAGAIGVKTKLLLKKYPDWRWGSENKQVQYYLNHQNIIQKMKMIGKIQLALSNLYFCKVGLS